MQKRGSAVLTRTRYTRPRDVAGARGPKMLLLDLRGSLISDTHFPTVRRVPPCPKQTKPKQVCFQVVAHADTCRYG
jgi:hypothetical protein